MSVEIPQAVRSGTRVSLVVQRIARCADWTSMMLPLRALTTVAAVAVLAGCAHSLVYDEARDKAGQEAMRAASALKLADTVGTLEKGYAEVARLELEGTRSFAETLRNKEVARVARARALREDASLFSGGEEVPDEFNGLLNVIEARMADLGAKTKAEAETEAKAKAVAAPPGAIATGGPAAGNRNCDKLDCRALITVDGTPVAMRKQREAFALSRAEFRGLFGHDFRTCADVEAVGTRNKDKNLIIKEAFSRKLADAAQRSGMPADELFTALGDLCARMAANDKRFDEALSPNQDAQIRAVIHQAERAERDIAAHRAKLVEAEDRLATAVKAFIAEDKKLAPGESNLAKLQELADNLRAIVQVVRTGADVLGDAGAHAAAKEVIGQLDTVLGAIGGVSADAEKLDAHDRAAVAFVRAFPELADEADKLLKEAGRARLVPFAMAREHYRLALKGFEDELALKILRAEALRARADAVTHELSTLAHVHFLLTTDKRAWEKQTLAKLKGMPEPKDRTTLFAALALYWDEVFEFRSEADLWKSRASALNFEQNLVRSKTAAMQWDNLVSGVGTALADYYAAGIKPAEIAAFLQAFGVIYIGTRVGK